MAQRKAERVAELAEKVCSHGHIGDWVARKNGTTYCVACSTEAIKKHKLRKGAGYLTQEQIKVRQAIYLIETAPTVIHKMEQQIQSLLDQITNAKEVLATIEATRPAKPIKDPAEERIREAMAILRG